MKTLLVLCCALIAWPLAAQTVQRQAQVYRCGPEGRDLRDSPCPGQEAPGGPVTFDQPSDADSRAARSRHLAEAKQAAALAAARRASEAEDRRHRATAVGLQKLPEPAQAASAAPLTPVKPGKTFKARPPQPAPAASAAEPRGR
ncbi:hypothetical protein [Roseateles sp. BYS87W]|uniref:DUF4124 domain-containing protein n=1 Tax=Pelomonas baiyunensis TaxID=3299026 RepID=A0ABW7H2R7_9BURK